MFRRSITPIGRILRRPQPYSSSSERSFTSFTQNKLNPNSPTPSFLRTPFSASYLLPNHRLPQGFSSVRFMSGKTGQSSAANVFLHVSKGIESILADYVHQEMSRTWILICVRLFLIILIKDAFLSLYSITDESDGPEKLITQ